MSAGVEEVIAEQASADHGAVHDGAQGGDVVGRGHSAVLLGFLSMTAGTGGAHVYLILLCCAELHNYYWLYKGTDTDTDTNTGTGTSFTIPLLSSPTAVHLMFKQTRGTVSTS